MSNQDLYREFYKRNAKNIYRICFLYLKNHHDTEDAVQTCFVKAFENHIKFDNPAHERAWLAVTAANICKSILRKRHKKDIYIEDLPQEPVWQESGNKDVLIAVMNLPDKYKDIVYLHYYEGYSTAEVANILSMKDSTVRCYLRRSRELLKIDLGGESS